MAFITLVTIALFIPFVAAQSTGAGLNKVAKAAGKLYFGTATDNPGRDLTTLAIFCNEILAQN